MQSATPGKAGPPAPDPWQRLQATASWDDLVLPERTLRDLRSVPALFSARFWASSSGGGAEANRGLLLLFRGPGGTGKTTAAHALAHELHLPLLHADLAAMFERGRAEAIQLLARLFATAQRLGAVVVLDHADAALGSLDSNGGQAGPAAIDVRDVLRRARTHPGIVIVPSESEAPLPVATVDRFDRAVEFPLPGAEARTELWRRSLPPGAQLADGDIALLATAFELSGGAIAATCADAAARAGGQPVGRPHIAAALTRQTAGHRLSERAEAALGLLHEPGSTPAARTPPPAWVPPPPPPPEPAPAPRVMDEPPTVAAPPAPAAFGTPARAAATPTGDAPAPVAATGRPERPLTPTRGRLAAVAIVGALVAIVLGLSASSHKASPAKSASTPARVVFNRTGLASALELTYFSDWAQIVVPQYPDLNLGSGLAFSSSGQPVGELVVGMVSTSPSAPLPEPYLADHVTTHPTPRLVVLGGYPFEEVVDPRLERSRSGEAVFALATTSGTVVGLCKTASQVFVARCERVLGTVATPSGSRLVPYVDRDYARRLSLVMAKFNRTSTAAAHQLSAAGTPQAQASAALSLAGAAANAAASVSGLSAGPAATANAALGAALRQESSAYVALSAAAAKKDAGGYATAQRSATTASAAVAAALSQLSSFGYSVG